MKRKDKSNIIFFISLVMIIINIMAILFNGLTINRVLPIVLSIFIIILAKSLKNLYPISALFALTGIIESYPALLIISGCGLFSSFMKADEEDDLKTFIKKNTLLSSVVIGISGISLVSYSALINYSSTFTYGPEMLSELAACVGLGVLIFICHKYRFIIRNEVTFFEMIKISLPIWIFMFISFSVQILSNIYTHSFESSAFIIILILSYMLVGLFEEFLLRGIVLNILLDKYKSTGKKIWFAVVVSSLIFGLAHYMNLSTGASFFGVTMQVIAATAMGIYLAAIYLRTNNIWYNALIHGLWDVIASISFIFVGNEMDYGEVISGYSLPMLVPAVFYIIFSLFLLRKKKMKNVINKVNNKPVEKEEYNNSVRSVQIVFASTAVVFSVFAVIALIYDFNQIDKAVTDMYETFPKFYDNDLKYLFTDDFKDEDLTPEIKLYMAAAKLKVNDIENSSFTIKKEDLEKSYKELFDDDKFETIDFDYSRNHNCFYESDEWNCDYYNTADNYNIKVYSGIKTYDTNGVDIEVFMYYFVYDLDNNKIYGDSSLKNLLYSGNIDNLISTKFDDEDRSNTEFFEELDNYFDVPVYHLTFSASSTLNNLVFKEISIDTNKLELDFKYDKDTFKRTDSNNKINLKKDDENYIEIKSISQAEYLEDIVNSNSLYIKNNKYYYNPIKELYLINNRYEYYSIYIKNTDYSINEKFMEVLSSLSI